MQNRGILVMLRAAAIVVIATGVSDVVASAVPRYEPLYLYLAAVALVSLLDGVIAGLAAAIVSVAAYALLFMPRADALSTRILVPAGLAMAVAIVASVVRGLVRARRRVAEPAPAIPMRPPLLATSTLADATSNNEEVLAAIDDLRADLRSAISDLGTSRRREDALAEELRAATRRAFEAERVAHGLREESASTAGRLAELSAATAMERAIRERSESEAIALRERLAAAEGRAAADVARIAELERLLAEVRAAAGAQSTRVAERDRALHAERAARERLEREAAALAVRAGELEGAVAEERATRERAEGEEAALAGQVAASALRIAELERAVNDERATRERLEAGATRVAELELAVENERVAREHFESEAAARAGQLAAAAARIAELERAVDDGRAAHERLEGEAATVAGQVAAGAVRVAELERAVNDERATRERLESEAASRAEELAAGAARIAELERALNDERATREARESELSAATSGIVDLEQSLAAERAARAADAAQFDTKLQTIVTHLASDHEADLGQAVSDREEARAEARALAKKLGALQRKHDEDRAAAEALLAETRAAALAEIQRMRAQLAPAAQAARPRILVVHPDAELRTAASATLERAGYEVVGAADGLEALRVAIAAQPAAVIAESSMPKMDGRELCQLMKSQQKTAHIRFVLLSRATDPERARTELSPDEVLRKPVPVETLKATLASLLAPADTR